jgi:hypothetical protein
VIDLGLAWRDGMTRHTETGAAIGSVGYMAPEQVEGGRVDTPADIWALGVMLYEWVAGRRPFARPRPSEEAAAALIGTCAKLTAADRRADDALAELVARCLALDPLARPTAAELAAGLTAMIDWADPAALADERAAVVADPIGYQARVAPLRIRRLERQAREALDAGRPFAALALCDRGLAYAPDHGGLAALVAEVEAATAAAAPASAGAATGTAAPSAAAPSAIPAGVAPPAVVTTGGERAAATPIASTVPSNRARTWLLATAIAVGAVGFTIIIALLARRAPGERGAGSVIRLPDRTATSSAGDGSGGMSDADGMAVARGMLNLFDRVVTADEERRAAAKAAGVDPGPGPVPTTATQWLDRAETQPAATAIGSVRMALSLEPGNRRGRGKLCQLGVVLADVDAQAVCVDAAACAAGGDCSPKPVP